ncbi:MAG: hypothetical protein ACN4GT_00165 [Gammaproteobacteria bacterium]
MHDGKALHPRANPARNHRRRLRQLLFARLWLPRIVYEALPYLYIVLGVTALGSAMFTPDWTWIFPWAMLIGLICLHAGLALVTLRYRIRRGRKPPTE